jgi:hypothetical protein
MDIKPEPNYGIRTAALAEKAVPDPVEAMWAAAEKAAVDQAVVAIHVKMATLRATNKPWVAPVVNSLNVDMKIQMYQVVPGE